LNGASTPLSRTTVSPKAPLTIQEPV